MTLSVSAEESYSNPEQIQTENSLESVNEPILAMLGVAFSSFFIYFVLIMYNKIRDSFVSPKADYKYDEPTLDSPEDTEDAVRSFLERTNW